MMYKRMTAREFNDRIAEPLGLEPARSGDRGPDVEPTLDDILAVKITMPDGTVFQTPDDVERYIAKVIAAQVAEMKVQLEKEQDDV